MMRRTAAAVLGLTGALSFAGALSVGGTSAQWSDPAVVAATASVGTFPTVTVDGCAVRYQANDQIVPGTTCSVTLTKVSSWTATQGYVTWKVHASEGTNSEYISFSVTAPVGQFPVSLDWTHVASTVTGGTLTTTCHDYPTFTGRLQANYGATPEINITFTPGPACA